MTTSAFHRMLATITLMLATSLPPGCASVADADESADEEDIVRTNAGVALEQSDNNSSFSIAPKKTVVLTLTYGGIAASHGKWSVTSTDRTFGYPKEKSKTPRHPDAMTIQTFTWTAPSSPGAHRVVLSANPLGSGRARTFSFTARVETAPQTAKLNQRCGGSTSILCEEGLQCMFDSAATEVDGVCKRRAVGARLGETCNGIAAIRCGAGLVCRLTYRHPDSAGVCVADE